LNSGQYVANSDSDSTLGLENTRNRLDLSFGKRAWMTIGNQDDETVKTFIHIPKTTTHDTSIDH
jgi:sensor histidine kinase YesM